MDDAILIFTRKGMPSFLDEGGSGHWKVRPNRVNGLTYGVLCRNRHSADPVEGTEPHGAGFLVARVSGVVPSLTRPGRSIIQFSEVAEISMPDLWPGYRVPTTYTSLEELGIDPSTLDWQPMPGRSEPDTEQKPARRAETVGEIIRRWKVGLATDLGMSPEQIEVTFRG